MTTDLDDRVRDALTVRAALASPVHDIERVVDGSSGRAAGIAAGSDPERAAEIDPGLALANGGGTAPAGAATLPTTADASVEVVARATRRRRRRWVPVVASAAALAGVVGIAVAVSRGAGSQPPAWGQPGSAGSAAEQPALSWVTPHAAFSAASVTIDYLGRTFTPAPDAVAESSLLSRSEELLRISWPQDGIEVAWELYLKSRGGEWWVEEITVLDERTNAEGNPGLSAVHIGDDSERVPFGSALTGDLDVSATEADATARVRVTGMTFLGFRDRGPDGDQRPVETSPPPVLVAAPALPDDVVPTGMYPSAEEWMAMLVAEDALTRDCMSAAGIEYPPIPDDVLVQTMGQSDLTAGLSVHGRAAAAATGYHTVDIGILNGGAHGIPQSLSDADQRTYESAIHGCIDTTAQVLGGNDVNTPMRAWEVVGDIRSQAFGDPDVIAALTQWRQCVAGAVGESAANPNELARMYAFDGGDPARGTATEHEKAVAVADHDCQQQVDYETVWYTAVVERERAAMADRVGEYDDWIREIRTNLARAQQVLDERGIVLPSLD